MNAVAAEGVWKFYGDYPALRDVMLHAEPGACLALIGRNGAGKTTLLRIVAGLLEPTAGTVTLDGTELTGRPERVWPILGYLPQEFGFYPHLTGEKMLAYLLELKGINAPGGRKALCRELLERVNLGFAARRKVKGYSGGMRQRLGIAQAIAGDPRLLIVDEPTAGLDPEERLRFYRLLSELAADRIVLLSTHIVEDVAVLCPRFAMIRGGRLIAYTTPAEARAAIEGTIHEGTISAHDYHRLLAESDRCVTQAYLVEGRNRVRVYQPDGQPPEGFVNVPATLEDAYLVAIKTGRLETGAAPWAGAKAVVSNGADSRTVIAERGDR
jgi:ABC-2 type transport system ATP-binding protein